MKRIIKSKKNILIFVIAISVSSLIVVSLMKKRSDHLATSNSIFESEKAIELSKEAAVSIQGEGGKLYKDDLTGISFRISSDMNVGSFDNGEGEYTIVCQNTTKGIGMQIVVSPFDEPNISPERIKKDLPDIKMKNISVVPVSGVDAVLFESDNEAFGKRSVEIWLVKNGKLVQMSSYLTQKDLLISLSKTLTI